MQASRSLWVVEATDGVETGSEHAETGSVSEECDEIGSGSEGSIKVGVSGDGECVVGLVIGSDTDEDTGRRISGTDVGTGCAAAVVVFSAGANASFSIASGLMGQIPVFSNAF